MGSSGVRHTHLRSAVEANTSRREVIKLLLKSGVTMHRTV
jgi:hypothetical protein